MSIFGILFKAALLVIGLAWCFYIIKRLPKDMADLRDNYTKYRKRNDPALLEVMKSEERIKHYQETCALEFWSTLGICLLFWIITALVLVFLYYFIRSLILPILPFLG